MDAGHGRASGDGERVCRQGSAVFSVTPPVPPTPQRRTTSGLGIHYIGPGAFVSLQRGIQACSVPLVVDVNEDKAGIWLRQNSPGTAVLFRVRGQDQSLDWGTGRDKINRLLAPFRASDAHYLSTANEWMDDSSPATLAAHCQQYLEAMNYANGLGIKITVADLSTHHPNLNIPGMMDAMRPMFIQAARDGHPANIHVYLAGGDLTTDPGVWQAIGREFPTLKIIIGELGIRENDGTMTANGFANLLRYDELLTTQVIGAALYTLTDTTWEQCRWDTWIADYAAHVRNWR